MRRDFPRLNSTLIEAYAAEPSREQLQRVRDATREAGAQLRPAHHGRARRHDLDRRPRAGPHADLRPDRRRDRGALPGGRRGRGPGLAQHRLHRHRRHELRHRADHRRRVRHQADPDIGRFILNLPLVQVDSIGAGTGSFVRIDPNSGRPELGPDSAGAAIGVCWAEGGLETPSGHRPQPGARPREPGLLPRRRDQARRRARPRGGRGADREPLGLSPEQAAAGIDRAVRRDAQVRGGGAGARQGLLAGGLHAALLRRRRAAARRRLHAPTCPTATCSCPPGRPASPPSAAPAATTPTATTSRSTCRSSRPQTTTRRPAWRSTSTAVGRCCASVSSEEFAKSGVGEDQIEFRHYVRMQYCGQLNDLEIYSPHQELSEGAPGGRPDRGVRGGLREALRPLGAFARARAIW